MRRSRFGALVLLVAFGGRWAVTAAAEPMVPDTDEKRTLYALGLAMSTRIAAAKLSAQDVTWIQAGLADGILGQTPKVDLQAFGPKIEGVLRMRLTAAAAEEKKAGQAFRDRLATEAGAVKTDSGLLYFEQRAGTGATPAADATVKIHYNGTLRDGKVFDSSMKAGEPVTFKLDQVVPCFSEGLKRMKVGGKSKLVCPSELAYGDEGEPPMIPGGATLVFEVELLEVVPPPAPVPPAAPAGSAPAPGTP